MREGADGSKLQEHVNIAVSQAAEFIILTRRRYHTDKA